jgi:hypothetical protein
MDPGHVWFRFTQVAMKVSPIAVTLILLAPLALIFWRMARYQPLSEEAMRAEMEKVVRQQLAQSEAEIMRSASEDKAKQARAFEQMLEQAKLEGAAGVLSADGTLSEIDERVAALEQYVQSAAPSSSLPGEFTAISITTGEERIFLTQGIGQWFSLHPRRWVGILGLVAVVVILGLVMWSALVPARPPFSMSGSWDASGVRIDK